MNSLKINLNDLLKIDKLDFHPDVFRVPLVFGPTMAKVGTVRLFREGDDPTVFADIELQGPKKFKEISWGGQLLNKDSEQETFYLTYVKLIAYEN